MSQTFNDSSISIQDIIRQKNKLHVVYMIENKCYYCFWEIEDNGSYHLQQNIKLPVDEKVKNIKSRIVFLPNLDLIYVYNNSIRILKRIPLKDIGS